MIDIPPHDHLIDTIEAARILGVKPNTLAKARVYGGPMAIPFVKVGRRVNYSVQTIQQFIATNTAASTSEHVRAA